jgi:carboxylesterase type B
LRHIQVSRTCGRIFRDLVFTCQPIFYGRHLAQVGNEIYFYVQNQTTQTPFFESLGKYGIGLADACKLPYVWGNLSAYDGDSYQASESNLKLRDRETRSWSSFVAVGKPSLEGHDTLHGWWPAAFGDEDYGTFVLEGHMRGTLALPEGASSQEKPWLKRG